MTSRRSKRSFATVTASHLDRLSAIAKADHEFFTRPDGRPEFADRRVAVVLAQGGALHYLHGKVGVKDLDVWTFYAALPGVKFPAKRHRHVDFGVSEFGRHSPNLTAEMNTSQQARFRQWDEFLGRRVDLLMRDLRVEPEASSREVMNALRAWLVAGSSSTAQALPSSHHLAKKAMILIDPKRRRGAVVWPVPK